MMCACTACVKDLLTFLIVMPVVVGESFWWLWVRGSALFCRRVVASHKKAVNINQSVR